MSPGGAGEDEQDAEDPHRLDRVGLRDLTLFSVQGTGAAGPDASAETGAGTDEPLQAYFASSRA
jgi:hypothetical protein